MSHTAVCGSPNFNASNFSLIVSVMASRTEVYSSCVDLGLRSSADSQFQNRNLPGCGAGESGGGVGFTIGIKWYDTRAKLCGVPGTPGLVPGTPGLVPEIPGPIPGSPGQVPGTPGPDPGTPG